jgi:dTDP-4-amino-4,6-dideoxygalactose transaminase
VGRIDTPPVPNNRTLLANDGQRCHNGEPIAVEDGMIPESRRAQIRTQGRPATLWDGEPILGSVHGEEEIAAVVEEMRAAMEPTRGFGSRSPAVAAFESAFAAYVGTQHAVAVNSAGPGLDMAMRYLRLQPGDEVIVPALNFVAAPMAVMGAGGQVVWGEVDPRTLQLDPADVERRLTPRTVAIFPVHMNGLSAPMDDLLELARAHPHADRGPLAVVGDAARACGGGYRGQKIGAKGLMTVFSLHTMKNISTLGEGGMVTTDDDAVAAFCRATRFYGFGHEPDLWGTSNVMTSVQAAAGLVQLTKLDAFVAARRRLAAQRTEMLGGLPEITLPHEPDGSWHSYYLYTCLVAEEWAGAKRDQLLALLRDEYQVRCVIANRPVYVDREVMRAHTPGQRLPLSEQLGERLFCPPIHPAMTDEDNEFICAAIIDGVERLR